MHRSHQVSNLIAHISDRGGDLCLHMTYLSGAKVAVEYPESEDLNGIMWGICNLKPAPCDWNDRTHRYLLCLPTIADTAHLQIKMDRFLHNACPRHICSPSRLCPSTSERGRHADCTWQRRICCLQSLFIANEPSLFQPQPGDIPIQVIFYWCIAKNIGERESA